MDETTKQAIIQKAGELMDAGYHCSEAILLAVGGHYLGEVSRRQCACPRPSRAGWAAAAWTCAVR